MMARIAQALDLLQQNTAGGASAFQREIKPLQRVVEDLCKLRQADQIMTQVRASLEKAIKAKFDVLTQLASQPSGQSSLLAKANEFWVWLC